PAPRRCERSRVEPVPTRRVWRVPVRAEPIAADASRAEEVRVEPRWSSRTGCVAMDPGASGTPAPSTADGDAPVAAGVAVAVPPPPSGEPQTLHQPSSYVPVQPGWVHAVTGSLPSMSLRRPAADRGPAGRPAVRTARPGRAPAGRRTGWSSRPPTPRPNRPARSARRRGRGPARAPVP